MSSNRIAVSLHRLGKSYPIAARRERPTSFGEMISERLRHPFRRAETQTYWALRDISLDIEYGDTIGIIGRNGAGKSTLLKVLSRITDPTEGEVALYGRVGSLLEVGTGFHPELTGRENIFLNGAILGMRRSEIARQFEAIVAFSGVEEFLDTPVKRYSSGMYTRLAFAVAAHLETEILLVDEVLAVGDAEFQQKCLGKMKDVAAAGRAVLFVSHSTAAVKNLCRKCLVLDKGQSVFFGDTEEALDCYSAFTRAKTELSAETDDFSAIRPSWARPLICRVRLVDSRGEPQTHFAQGTPFIVEMDFESQEVPLRRPVMGVIIRHLINGAVGGVNMRMTDFTVSDKPYRRATLRCILEAVPLLQGQYTIDLWLGDGVADIDMLAGCLELTIEESDIYGTGRSPFAHQGSIYLKPLWEMFEF